MTIAGLGLFGRLAQLTVIKGSSLRVDAEQRLSREVWTPTVRGSILDRKGRVLAQDRPAYDILLDYSVIDGTWAARQARRAAIRMAGSRWSDIGKPGQSELIAEIQPQYEAHVANARRLLANTLGISQQELDDRINTIVSTVERRQQAVTRTRLDNRMRDAREKNIEVTEAMLRKFEREAAEPIEDKIRSHVIARGAQDAIGFAARRLATDSVDIALSAVDASEKLQLAADRVETVPIVPGLSVTDSNQREYPLEHQIVTLDTSLYPSVLRDSPVTVDIDGVGQLLIGKLRNQVFGDRVDDKGRTIQGDTTRRAAFLKDNPSLAERALLPTDDEDLPRVDRGAYREGDRIGETGVEASQEHWLRGLRGLQTTQLESGNISTIDSTPGRSVQLTIDAVLQAKVQALLAPQAGLATVQPWHFSASSPQQDLGQELYGGAVVIDIASGDILAAASSPTISREQLAQDPSLATDELRRPFFNRAFASEYPPGSIVKPIMLCEAAKRGLVQPGERIACTGHYLTNNPNVLRCLIFKTYGTTHSQRLNHDPSPVEAIGVSCNIFFYTMGDRLGPDGIRGAFQNYGVGERFGLGAGFEAPGSLGTNGPSSITKDDAIQMGIGQGPVTWTALHAANAYATIARNGQYLKPRLVVTDDVRQPRDMGYPASAISEAMQGLWFAINDPAGSGHHLGGVLEQERIFTVPGVKIWGKTGTAAAPDLRIDPDGDGPQEPQVVRSGDHSWFVVLAGRDRPQFAIAVVIEYGGSGGKVSGPIVNQIVKALVDEGLM